MKSQMPAKVPAFLHLRLKPEEVRYIRKEAQNSGQTVSEWMRKKLLSDYAPDILSDIPPSVSSNSPELTSVREERDGETGKNLAPQVFSGRPAKNGAGTNLASERTGHPRGCPCFACERLRSLLREIA